MGDLAYNEIFNQGSSKKQHLSFSLKKYSEACVAYELEKEKEVPVQKSYTNNWKKIEIHNVLGESTNKFLYRQTSTCLNIKDLKLELYVITLYTICVFPFIWMKIIT